MFKSETETEKTVDDYKAIMSDTYYSIYKENIVSCDLLFRSLFIYKDFDSKITEAPKKFFSQLFCKADENQTVYPCDIFELRPILTSNKIKSSRNIGLFNYSFAQKHLKQYSLFLVFNSKDILKCSKDYGSFHLFEENNISNILDYLSSIVVLKFKSGQLTLAQNIVEDLGLGVEVCANNHVPILEDRKFASKKEAIGSPGGHIHLDAYDGYEDQDSNINRMKGIQQVKNYLVPEFQEGDKVRLRQSGGVFKQNIGTVVGFRGNDLIVNFETGDGDGKEYKFDLNKPDRIVQLLQKV